MDGRKSTGARVRKDELRRTSTQGVSTQGATVEEYQRRLLSAKKWRL